MKIFRKHDFGEVTGREPGWSPVGRSMMTTFLFVAGAVMIDTGLRGLRRKEQYRIRGCALAT